MTTTIATLTGILNRALAYAFINLSSNGRQQILALSMVGFDHRRFWPRKVLSVTWQSAQGSPVVTCSGLLWLLARLVSGGPSWDSCLHRPFVVSLNIMSFSSRLSCLAIGSTRGLLQETINTTISFLLTLLYQSEATRLDHRGHVYSDEKRAL